MRNLDLTALRSFVAVADTGGVTRAAGLMNLTQSAVSMQIKRLEDALEQALLDRSARQISLTPAGDQLLGYARQMLSLNDEAYARLTATEFVGKIRLGVPHDIVYPAIPKVLQQFASRFPRMHIQLVTSFTNTLKVMFARGELEMMLTTEEACDPGGVTLTRLPLVWVGAQGGQAWRKRPLPIAFEQRCRFRPGVQRALDAAGIDWVLAVETSATRAIEATVSADLAVHAMLEGTESTLFERIGHGGGLPDLAVMNINLYVAQTADGQPVADLGDIVRAAFDGVKG